jgi:tripartite-type tricarboxylate transporter receptor subunit TctC
MKNIAQRNLVMTNGIGLLRLSARMLRGLMFALGASAALAQPYPSKPIRIIVPFAAGGPTDVIARAVAKRLPAALGSTSPVIVDDRPGAGEMIAASLVAKAAPDGYTLLLHADGALSTSPLLFKKLPYDLKEFQPLTRIATAQMVLAVPSSLPVKSMQELVQYGKAHPHGLSYGSGGNGSTPHLGMAWLAKRYGFNATHVAYRGLSPALQDLVAGNIQALMGSPSVMLPFASTGSIRFLGISGSKRAPVLPDVPTYTQAGFPDIDQTFYVAVTAPAGLPARVQDKLVKALHAVIIDPKFQRTTLEPFNMDAVADGPMAFQKFLQQYKAQQAGKIAAANLEME